MWITCDPGDRRKNSFEAEEHGRKVRKVFKNGATFSFVKRGDF